MGFFDSFIGAVGGAAGQVLQAAAPIAQAAAPIAAGAATGGTGGAALAALGAAGSSAGTDADGETGGVGARGALGVGEKVGDNKATMETAMSGIVTSSAHLGPTSAMRNVLEGCVSAAVMRGYFPPHDGKRVMTLVFSFENYDPKLNRFRCHLKDVHQGHPLVMSRDAQVARRVGNTAKKLVRRLPKETRQQSKSAKVKDAIEDRIIRDVTSNGDGHHHCK